MEQIYEKHLWGGKNFNFYSGEGSHNPEIITPYLEAVSDFLKSKNGNLTVCDLGCGDFNIGQHLVQYTKNYIAVDIVDSLIERNKTLFKANNLEFYCLDISKDELPKADCVILRQVLQHLSNEEIKNILAKLYNYKYVILTEHLPNRHFIPNKDKIASQGIRLKQNSGVNLLAQPFNLRVKSSKTINQIFLDNNKGRIATLLHIL
ncbi:class I SAM-dependent methyltransferase [Winogradskyella flava]|uniref:Class I SAM-dependent methyltransferase n=1 Tax=Winogradskyella flava TaxID=1884876 RepID=A0A842IX99_9FLAO|nr:class I SAM-dependent methyltransferase [Winogradskyella flava]MBC2846303.1 class I SAM-dependent methyltransferase [Winogradskyella flava]